MNGVNLGEVLRRFEVVREHVFVSLFVVDAALLEPVPGLALDESVEDCVEGWLKEEGFDESIVEFMC